MVVILELHNGPSLQQQSGLKPLYVQVITVTSAAYRSIRLFWCRFLWTNLGHKLFFCCCCFACIFSLYLFFPTLENRTVHKNLRIQTNNIILLFFNSWISMTIYLHIFQSNILDTLQTDKNVTFCRKLIYLIWFCSCPCRSKT